MSEDANAAIVVDDSIPVGWVWATFDEVCAPISDGGRKVQQAAYLETGLYPVVDQGEDLIGGYTNDATMLVQSHTPVIVFGDHTRRFKPIDQPFVVGADGVKLIGPSGAWNARCLWYFLCGLRFEDRGYSRHFQFLRRSRLPLPPSAEQVRIAEALDELYSDLDAAVAALERVRAKLKLYRASVLKAAVEGALTAEWRAQHPTFEPASELLDRILAERRRLWEEGQLAKFKARGQEPAKGWKAKYREPATYDANVQTPLPATWCRATTEQVCNFITKGTTPGGADAPRPEAEVPFIKVQHLSETGSFGFGDSPSFVSRRIHEGVLARSRVLPGDVLMNIVGPPLGQVSIVPPSFAEWNVNQAIAIFRPLGGLSNRLLALWLLSRQVLAQALSRTKTTAGQVNLTLEVCRTLTLPLPPAAEQEAIVELVDDQMSVIDHLEADIDAKLKSAQSLRQAILRHAFGGKLVPQDPNDEPASELLKRIAAQREERAQATDSAKGRKTRRAARRKKA